MLLVLIGRASQSVALNQLCGAQSQLIYILRSQPSLADAPVAAGYAVYSAPPVPITISTNWHVIIRPLSTTVHRHGHQYNTQNITLNKDKNTPLGSSICLATKNSIAGGNFVQNF